MTIKTVQATSPEGRVVTLVESAFRKVWASRGFQLVEEKVDEDVHLVGDQIDRGVVVVEDAVDAITGQTPPAPAPSPVTPPPAAGLRSGKSEQTAGAESKAE